MSTKRPCTAADIFVTVESYARNGRADYWMSQAWCHHCGADAHFDECLSADDAADQAAWWSQHHPRACRVDDQVLVGVDDAVLAQCRQCRAARTFTGANAVTAAERWQVNHVAHAAPRGRDDA